MAEAKSGRGRGRQLVDGRRQQWKCFSLAQSRWCNARDVQQNPSVAERPPQRPLYSLVVPHEKTLFTASPLPARHRIPAWPCSALALAATVVLSFAFALRHTKRRTSVGSASSPPPPLSWRATHARTRRCCYFPQHSAPSAQRLSETAGWHLCERLWKAASLWLCASPVCVGARRSAPPCGQVLKPLHMQQRRRALRKCA